MRKTKELVICIALIIGLILTITTTVSATDSIQDLNSLIGNTDIDANNNEFEEIEDDENTLEGNDIVGNSVENIGEENLNPINTSGTSKDGGNTNTIPYTGVSHTSLVIIAVATVSAIYAYKKIKEYNV